MDLKKLWNRLHTLPGGKFLFSKIVGFQIPYTGSIRPHIEKFDDGQSEVRIRDRRAIRNHLQCVHAIALANVGELCSGIAVWSRLPDNARMILTRLEIEYSKKSRGTLVAMATCPPILSNDVADFPIDVLVKDSADTTTAKLRVTWRVGPKS